MVMTTVSNISKVIADAVKQGIQIEQQRKSTELSEARAEVGFYRRKLGQLSEERDILVKRVDQLTRDQWTDIKAVIDHLHPENDLTREKLAEITARRAENRAY